MIGIVETKRGIALNSLDEVRRLVEEALINYRARVYLFGSWATGKAHRGSDIDIAIEAEKSISREALAHLRERLEESHIPYRVEVVLLNDADDALRRRILAEGVLWKG